MAAQLLETERVMGDKLIGSLALMRASILPDDFISSYIPFVATLLYEGDYQAVDLDLLIREFPARYGFKIPRMPMITILKKCASKGMITKTTTGYNVVREAVSQYSFDSDTKSEILKYDTIVDKLKIYARTHFAKKYDDVTAQDIILAFLENNSAKTITFSFSEYTEEERKSKQNMYIVSEFISNAAKTDYGLFGLIREISFAYMMASAITFGLEMESDEKKASSHKANTGFQNLTLYLDTPFLLRLLGLNTDEMRDASLELVSGLKENGVSFKIFGHTYDETLRIIEDCENWVDNPQYEAKYASLALRTFVSRSYTKHDVSVFIADMPNKLAELSIGIDDTDYYHVMFDNKQIDEAPIREYIISTYKQSNSSFDETQKSFTIECDVRSITHILKLWPRKRFRSYYDATYLFLTTNSTLAYATRRFTSHENRSAMFNVFPCITDVFLGTIMWLDSPISAIESFSKKKLLADCMAAVSPSEELIKRLSDSIEEMYSKSMISEKEYYLLKARAYQKDYLQRKTLNDENAFTDRITEEILEELKADLVAPINSKVKELEAEKQKLQEKITSFEKKEDAQNNDAREKERAYESSAEKKLQLFANVLIPITVSFIALLIILFTNLLSLSTGVSILLKITAGFVSLSAACVLAILKTKNRIKASMFKSAIKRAKVRDYKREIK